MLNILVSILGALFVFCNIVDAITPLRSDLENGGPETEHILNERNNPSASPRYRLPNNVIPIHYNLEIRPILDPGYGTRFTAPGKVRILVNCTANTDNIILHSLNVVVNNLTVSRIADNADIPVVSFLPNTTYEILTVQLGTPGIVAGNQYEIYIEFVAPIPAGRVDGLYLTSYEAEGGETRYIATTHQEPDDCRRIFPLFDEPSMKAKWSVSIIRKTNYHSMANQALLRTEPVPNEPEWEKDIYEELNLMSSYLLAFAVSDFISESAQDGLFDKPVRVWGPPPLMNEGAGKYAPDISAKFLQFFETTFDFKYELSKMDEIAFPDFAIGAMENWGMNTYRESRLLFLEGISTVDDKIKMTNTISHELSHQWFGDLITMKWWNDSWLKEGFATYLANLGVQHVFPDYGALDSFVTNSMQVGMQADALPTTHPLSPPPEDVETAPQLAAAFSTIVYNKGASMCRMMNAFLSEDVFLSALRKYLKKYAYTNNDQNDLFTIIEEEAIPSSLPTGVTVNTIMDTWTRQSGYPIVTATRTAVNPTSIGLIQNKYGGNPTPPTSWWIPVALVTKGYDTTDAKTWTETEVWLSSTAGAHPVTIPITDWYLVNPAQIGNYRVLYDDENLGLIINQLIEDHSKIDPSSRSALLDDYFNLAFSNQGVMINRTFELTKYMSQEFHLAPWVTFFTNSAVTYRMLGRSSSFLDFMNYYLSLIEPALQEIKMSPQPTDPIGALILLRTRLVEWACNLGSPACISFAKESVVNWTIVENPVANNLISPDLRSTLYCAAMASGGDDVWNFFVDRYEDAHLATSSKYLPDMARISLIRALGCSKQSYRLAKLLDLAIDPESFLRAEHRLTAIQAVAGNSAGVDLTFNFLRNNFDTIVRRFGLSMFTSSVSTLSNYLSSELAYADLTSFILRKGEQLDSVKTSLDASLANIRKNIIWVSDHSDKLRTFFKANV